MTSFARDFLDRVRMYCFGRAAISFIAISALAAGMMLLLRPGWGSLLSVLVGRLIYLSFFAALVFGIVGIINDCRKFFAIASVVIAVIIVLYIWVCQWLSVYYNNLLQWFFSSSNESLLGSRETRGYWQEKINAFWKNIRNSADRSRRDADLTAPMQTRLR